MKRVFLVAGSIGLMLVLGCAHTPDSVDGPLVNETTLARFDGSTISREDLRANRATAVATAKTIERIEKELLEPWAEQREPHIFLEQLGDKFPAETRHAITMWGSSEPLGRGQNRVLFGELGFYGSSVMPNAFGPRIRPATLDEFVERMMREHSDMTPEERLLAAWRRFSPAVIERQTNYLSSHWELTLDYVTPVRLAVNDSLMGPHIRSEVIDPAGASFPGATETVEGYTANALMIELMLPGGDSPVRPAIESMNQAAMGARIELPFEVGTGPAASDGASDRKFLRAVLSGLMDGTSELDALPGAAARVSVTFSYLLDDAEARSTLTFERNGAGWKLTRFDYEPAAASLLEGNARLDLMPIIRDQLVAGRAG